MLLFIVIEHAEHWTHLVFVFSVRLEHVVSALLDIHYSVTLNILQCSALIDNTVLFVDNR